MITLKQLILSEHSKAQAMLIADIVRQKPELLQELISYTFANEEPLSRRAAWPLRILHEQYPELFEFQIDYFIESLKKNKADQAVLRNILAILSKADIAEDNKSFLLDFVISTLLDPSSSTAVIAYATDLFVNIAKNELILLQELLLILSQLENKNSNGIFAKIRQVKRIADKLENTQRLFD